MAPVSSETAFTCHLSLSLKLKPLSRYMCACIKRYTRIYIKRRVCIYTGMHKRYTCIYIFSTYKKYMAPI